MTIAFIHSQSSFLPELDAYHAFFIERGVQCERFDIPQWKSNKKKFDVEWFMMGTDTSQKNTAIRVHEYASSSTPPFMRLKNKMKRFINVTPDYRLFLNDYVRSCFGFADNTPWSYRDMGVSSGSPSIRNAIPDVDFFYMGSMHPGRNLDTLLKKFTDGDLRDRSILLLGKDYHVLQRKFSAFKNIRFEGPVPYAAVAKYMQQAAYAVNFIPTIAPYNMQTSTKLLEYIHQGLPIVTTDYPWMREFEKKYGGRYFYLDNKLENLTWGSVSNFPFENPDIRSLHWEAQILQSGIWEFLQAKSGVL